jgi:hypothetical protein
MMSSFSAEEEGFEPPVPRGTTVFKTAAFDHSAIPLCDLHPIWMMRFPILRLFYPNWIAKITDQLNLPNPTTNILSNIYRNREHFLSNISF